MWTLIVPLIFGPMDGRDWNAANRAEYRMLFDAKYKCEDALQALADRMALNVGPHWEHDDEYDQPEGIDTQWAYSDEPIGRCVLVEQRPELRPLPRR